jgi:hypothetical protein
MSEVDAGGCRRGKLKGKDRPLNGPPPVLPPQSASARAALERLVVGLERFQLNVHETVARQSTDAIGSGTEGGHLAS